MARIESYQQGTPNWVELTTPDQQGAKEFYGPLFGWDLSDMPVDDQGSYYVTAEIQGDQVAGISGQMPELAGHPAFWGVFLAVDDVDATVAKVEPAGGKVEAGPFDVMEFGRMAAIQDPTGARVNLWQAKDRIGTVRANEPGAPIWNELTSPDVPAAVTFYADVLGVSWEEMDMGEMIYRTMNVGGRQVAGAMPPMAEAIPPHWNVYFNTASVDDTIARAVELGGKVLFEPFDVPNVGRMAFLADPQGGMFALMQNPSE